MTQNKSIKKQYYVDYYNDFANTYNLYWASTPEQIKIAAEMGLERITRATAIKMCTAENERRRTDGSFSGYADNCIFPIDYNRMEHDYQNDSHVYADGYIVEYKN